jgi:prepilin-type N-terminal cleavage/methylation domain-containing protein
MENNKAFTLVELSIVLLIIGLVIGGISAGSSLIQQAKIRTVISEYNNYTTAINTFKIQFNALPGDLNNATLLWASCNASSWPCNGNGDGLISMGNENFQVWQHLSLAGVINYNWTTLLPEPTSKYGQAGWRIEDNGASIYTIAPQTRNALEFMITANAAGFIPSTSAYNIDMKTDDGQASNGKVYGLDDAVSGCVLQSDGVTAANPFSYNSTSAIYNIANPNKLCTRIYFYF